MLAELVPVCNIAAMPEEWDFYFCHVNGEPASIAVDLGIHASAPDSSRPHLLWVWLYFKTPRPDGLSDRSEFDAPIDVEGKITDILSQRFDALLSGRITTAGRREFYYYGSRAAGLEAALRGASNEFLSYKFDCGSKHDPEWTQYLDLLYPSEEQLECMKNRSVLDVLEKKGDRLRSPRDVSHWISFNSSADRQAFWTAAQALQYRLVSSYRNR